MGEYRAEAPGWLIRWELALVMAACAIGLGSIPVMLGHIGLSWDALNHHIYLGWTAEHPRFDRDYLAASYQAYQFPYLYWPAYRLAAANVSGATAGAVLALLQSLAAPPVWLVARACCPGDRWFDVCLRALGMILAFVGGVTLSLLDSTSNDMLAAVPLLWAVALAFVAADAPPRKALTWSIASGVCAGLAVACKLSNGPLVLVLPLAWLMATGTVGERLWRVFWAGLASIGGFVLAYGNWGWQLWLHTGNPVYPFYDGWFDRLRTITGWVP